MFEIIGHAIANRSDDILFYCLAFAIAFTAGISRCVRNGAYRSIVHCLAVGAVSGFLGFAVVGVLSGGDHSAYYLSVAAICGLAGKEQSRIIEIVYHRVLGRKDENDDSSTA